MMEILQALQNGLIYMGSNQKRKISAMKAFTIIELVFVIVIIGILSAIALPKFAETSKMAHLSKAKSVVANVQSSVATIQKKNILRGLSGVDVNRTAIGDDTNHMFTNLFNQAPKTCANINERFCWTVSGSGTSAVYTYRGPDNVDTRFTISGNRFACDTTHTPNHCNKFDN